MILDSKHLKLLKDPDNIRNVSLFTPEGYSTDHKRDLDNLSMDDKMSRAYKGERTHSSEGLMKKGLNYRFSLKDLSKYSKNLKYKDINWKVKLSALGK